MRGTLAATRVWIVVTCSAVTDYVLTRANLGEAVTRPGAVERRLVIDLGLPRNVDPAVADRVTTRWYPGFGHSDYFTPGDRFERSMRIVTTPAAEAPAAPAEKAAP